MYAYRRLRPNVELCASYHVDMLRHASNVGQDLIQTNVQFVAELLGNLSQFILEFKLDCPKTHVVSFK